MPSFLTSKLFLLCTSQTLSMTVLGISNFAIGVWVYLQTGSVTLFALLEVAAVLPGILISPMIGVYIDRLGAKLSLQMSDLLGALAALFLLLLFYFENNSLVWLFLFLGLSNMLTAGQFSAYTALSTQLSNKQTLAKTAAYTQMGIIGQRVLAPAIAGLLLVALTLSHILFINVLVFVMSVLVLVGFKSKKIDRQTQKTHWVKELQSAWVLIRQKQLFSLTRYSFITYFAGGFVIALATPLVLSIASPQTVGLVMTGIGSGMLVGNLFALKITNNQGCMTRLLSYDALMAVSMLAMLISHSSWAITVCGFLFSFGLAGLLCEEQAIWQIRINEKMQGKVFSLRKLLTWAALPISYACAGILADVVFEPMVQSERYIESISFITGVGAGRGMAILIALAGFLILLLVIMTLLRGNWKTLN